MNYACAYVYKYIIISEYTRITVLLSPVLWAYCFAPEIPVGANKKYRYTISAFPEGRGAYCVCRIIIICKRLLYFLSVFIRKTITINTSFATK